MRIAKMVSFFLKFQLVALGTGVSAKQERAAQRRGRNSEEYIMREVRHELL
jgi:hypothetical protein